jgi:hypothetical protein
MRHLEPSRVGGATIARFADAFRKRAERRRQVVRGLTLGLLSQLGAEFLRTSARIPQAGYL